MSGLNNLKTRLNYMGGSRQQGRMNEDKLRTLKKALIYSYQGATAILPDEKEFRCLMNPDNLKPDYDNMIISIPFEDVCLNSVERVGTTTEGLESIDIKPGDVFQWKENGSYWLVYLRYWRETAYFRAAVRRCDYEVEINGQKYKIYLKGPDETTINWNQKSEVEWNDLNYKIMIYITEDENTLNFFHRFAKIKIEDKNYQVTVVNTHKADGIIQVYLKEDYSNEIEEQGYIEPIEDTPSEQGPAILGNNIVKPFDKVSFEGRDLPNGYWEIDNLKKAKILNGQTENEVNIEIITGKSGNFNLIYKNNNDEEIISLPITIISL